MFALDDAAQAFGGDIGGRRLGCFGGATALSFYPTKTLGCYGDGGALLTQDGERAALYRSLRTHGEGGGRYEVLRTGMNGRLDTIQAAILLCKMELFDGELAARARRRLVCRASGGDRCTAGDRSGPRLGSVHY